MSLLTPARRDGRGRFLNPVPTKVGGLSIALKVLPQYLTDRAEREPRHPLGPFRTDPASYAQPSKTGLRVTWFGHSSLLVEIDGVRILIDPVWEERASPMQWLGPKRFFAPTIALEDLPPLDVILISHDHYDHLGEHTVRRLAALPSTANATWVTSLGVGARLKQFGARQGQLSARQGQLSKLVIRELDWTESAEITSAHTGKSAKITAWPSRHFSGRGLTDRFTTLWSAFVLEGEAHRILYGADSGYWPGYAEIGAKYPKFDLTMLEIGAWNEAWGNIHLGPANAARAWQDLGGRERAGLLMPIHWGLFNLALHAWRQPIQHMTELAAQQGIPLWSPPPGRPTDVVEAEHFVDHWWRQA